MSDERQRLRKEIELAFEGVELGEGVSLHQTIVIDQYGDVSDEVRAAAESDERYDWRKLVDDAELPRVRGVGGLSFYDAAGLRFHLPAYLSLALAQPELYYGNDTDIFASLLFQLTHIEEYNLERFAILDERQRLCVRNVLVYLRELWCLDDPAVDKAIDGYWKSVTPKSS